MKPSSHRRRSRLAMARLVFPLALFTLAMAPSSVAAQPCPGDCSGDRSVTVDEIVTVVNIALGTLPISQCLAADQDGNGEASVDELVRAINAALDGCPPVEELPEDWEEAVDATVFGWAMSGWGPGDGSLWVVGGGLFEGRILRKQAGAWSEVSTGLVFPLLNWVHGTSATDVFCGGNDGVILHFDGATWERQPIPTTLPIWGIWAVAPDDVWAVGGDNAVGAAPVVLRYDGTQWRHAGIPALERPRVRAFFKVWGSSASDIWMVGQNGAILHYDGEQFTEFGAGISQDLIGIWGTGPDNIIAVGGRGTAELARFDGVAWTKAPPSPLPGLNGVWLRSPDVAHAVGILGTVLRINPKTLAILEEVDVPTDLDLHATFGDASGQLLAFGANFRFPEAGVVLIRGLANED